MPPADFGTTLLAALQRSLYFATFSAAEQAHRAMDAGEVFGRIVLVP
jgi:hypothetical protein